MEEVTEFLLEKLKRGSIDYPEKTSKEDINNFINNVNDSKEKTFQFIMDELKKEKPHMFTEHLQRKYYFTIF